LRGCPSGLASRSDRIEVIGDPAAGAGREIALYNKED
jgi:hypothetical protein